MPVYDDWDSFARLAREVDDVFADREVTCSVLAVDDGSAIQPEDSLLGDAPFSRIDSIEVLHLVCNLGHQRAIAVGLVTVSGRDDIDAVVIMDSDGEDRPEDLPGLVRCLRESPDEIVVAHRAKRSEGLVFRLFYLVYKILFRLLTGKPISFGNFCVIPATVLKRMTFMPEIWNNLASAISRSRLPIRKHSTIRGTRYGGKSTMNMVSLIVHGMSALSVYSDVVFVRMLLSALGLVAMTVVGMAAALGIRLLTDWAIPGWTTSVVGSLLVVFLQAIILLLGAAFLLLNSRSSVSVIPALVAENYIWARKVLFAR